MASWLRHLTVMQRVLNNDAAAMTASRQNSQTNAGVKDEVSSNADSGAPESMDYHHDNHNNGTTVLPQQPQPPHSLSETGGRDHSEPPAASAIPRRPGVTTINGITSDNGTHTASSLPPAGAPPAHPAQPTQTTAQQFAPYAPTEAKQQTPDGQGNGMPAQAEGSTTSQDMTAPELCSVFERQLLEMDDLAAFMGGGV
jgi:hypothetical protein